LIENFHLEKIADWNTTISNPPPSIYNPERAMGFEPTTFSLARRRSTTELRPRQPVIPAESAESQNRTGDTAIFSRVLYQLSYLGLKVLLSFRKLPLQNAFVILPAQRVIVKKKFQGLFDDPLLSADLQYNCKNADMDGR
jgi:hypothetical protein